MTAVYLRNFRHLSSGFGFVMLSAALALVGCQGAVPQGDESSAGEILQVEASADRSLDLHMDSATGGQCTSLFIQSLQKVKEVQNELISLCQSANEGSESDLLQARETGTLCVVAVTSSQTGRSVTLQVKASGDTTYRSENGEVKRRSSGESTGPSFAFGGDEETEKESTETKISVGMDLAITIPLGPNVETTFENPWNHAGLEPAAFAVAVTSELARARGADCDDFLETILD